VPSPTGPADPSRRYVQQTITDLGQPLADVTFVVVDLETTGGAPEGAGITEIGAVKVRGGEQLGEFSTLVDPGGPVPPFIAVLTGITDAMLVGAPPLTEAPTTRRSTWAS
jgi:DNA polymerase-3 subunit epsilon